MYVFFETGSVEDEIDPSVLDGHDAVGELVQVVTEDVLFGRGKGLTTGCLKLLDILLSHVNEEGQIGRIFPETDCLLLLK